MSEKLDLTLEEIEARHVGEWISMEETAWDETGNPTKGVVVAHGNDRESLVQHTRKLHMQNPNVKTFVFYAGPKIPEGLVVIL